LLQAVRNGDIPEFIKQFESSATTHMSCFDIRGGEPEAVFHGFGLGMMVALENTHRVVSNREASFCGRPDISITPIDRNGVGTILEFKKCDAKS